MLYNGQYWSYADLYNAFPNVTFYVEFGNEPDNFYDSTASYYRYQAIAAYKQLWNNACNNVAVPWSQKYSRLKWAIAMPAHDYNYMSTVIQWQAFSSNTPGCNDDLNAGGVRDYYNVLTPHMYSDNSFGDAGTPSGQVSIYNFLLSDQCTKGIIVTEVGVHDGGGFPTKCTNALQQEITTYMAPYAKVNGYAWFYLGNTGDSDWVANYQIPNETSLASCSG